MHEQASQPAKERISWIAFTISFGFLILAIVLADSRTASAMPLLGGNVRAIPAFARKYGLPCSACHTAWPELNNFGQVFRDNGYQLMNDRDSPIWQNPTYWPMTLRITPNWHYEHTNHVPVDATPPATGTVFGVVQQHGFDLSGVDIWTAGTLFKNVSFSLLPSSDNTATFHFENAFVRFDNLLNSSWLNVKAGKFELDNLISEKRFLFLSANGGLYQTYHFVPVGDTNTFGLGDNQLGVELLGHSANSYRRYSASVLSSNEGNVGFGGTSSINPAVQGSRTYDAFLTFSQAFEVGKLGLQRLGAYYYVGRRPTSFQTLGGAPIPGTGVGNKSFYRVGFAGDLYILQGKWEFLPFFLHGNDNVFLGTATAATPGATLPAGAQGPTWNGGFIETHYYYSPQLVLTGRYEIIRMSRQAFTSNPANLGNIDAYSAGFRWYPIMFSRAGLAWHNEFSLVKTVGAIPLSGQGPGLPAFTQVSCAPVSTTCSAVWSRSLVTGFDFDF
jgi:hypothetical protein